MMNKVFEIICYIDLSDQSTKTLNYAMDMARRYYANLTVISVMEQPNRTLEDVLKRTISKDQLVEFKKRLVEDCEREFKKLCKRRNFGFLCIG